MEIDPRYSNLRLFAAERGIDYRLAWDLEHGARGNYRRPTLMAAEVAYRWAEGSVAGVLRGGQPSPCADGDGARPQPLLRPVCTFELAVSATPVPEDLRMQMIAAHRRQGHGDLCRPLAGEAPRAAARLPGAGGGPVRLRA